MMGPSLAGQLCSDGSGGMFAVDGGGSGADDGQGLLAGDPQASGAADPQRVESCGAEAIKLRWPAWFAGAYQPGAIGRVPCQGSVGWYAGQL